MLGFHFTSNQKTNMPQILMLQLLLLLPLLLKENSLEYVLSRTYLNDDTISNWRETIPHCVRLFHSPHGT